MDQLLPILMIVLVVSVVMMKQIGKITNKADLAPSQSFELYAKFSTIIQEHVREIKNSMDSSKTMEERKYKLISGRNEVQALEKISDFIRKLVFFETMMAKQKSAKEIEGELFGVLSGLETFLTEYCEEGENLAEELRNILLEEYEKLQN